MDSFEAKLSRATDLESRELLGVIASVIDREGDVLYHYASGHQSLAPDAPLIDHESIFRLASAGKFITHIAALQCVERGLITLDESVHTVLPELDNVAVLKRNDGPGASSKPFLLQAPTKKVTLRHLLSHSSGIDHESNDLVKEWRASLGQEPAKPYHPILSYSSSDYENTKNVFSTPFLFEPGEGWMYGASVEWTAAVVSRLTKQPLGRYVHEQIFAPLGMKSSTYSPQDNPDISARILRMVQRDEGNLLPVEYPLRELVSSVPDLNRLFADLLSPTSKLLKKELRDLLFTPQFALDSAARTYIQKDTENYAAPAGIPQTMTVAPVNHSLAALVVEEELPLSGFPAGTVTWNGMPNLIWALHQEKGLGMIFMTQLLPVDDPKTVDLAMEFMRSAWRQYG